MVVTFASIPRRSWRVSCDSLPMQKSNVSSEASLIQSKKEPFFQINRYLESKEYNRKRRRDSNPFISSHKRVFYITPMSSKTISSRRMLSIGAAKNLNHEDLENRFSSIEQDSRRTASVYHYQASFHIAGMGTMPKTLTASKSSQCLRLPGTLYESHPSRSIARNIARR